MYLFNKTLLKSYSFLTDVSSLPFVVMLHHNFWNNWHKQRIVLRIIEQFTQLAHSHSERGLLFSCHMHLPWLHWQAAISTKKGISKPTCTVGLLIHITVLCITFSVKKQNKTNNTKKPIQLTYLLRKIWMLFTLCMQTFEPTTCVSKNKTNNNKDIKKKPTKTWCHVF